MIHGFRGTHHGLERIIEMLPDHHIFVPDLPGFGESHPFTGNHDLVSYTKFLQAFIAHLHLPTPPVLLGHSFGSLICGYYAVHNSQSIDKLILVNPISSPALKGPRGIVTRLAIGYYWLAKLLPSRAAKAWLSAPPIVKVMSVAMAKSNDKDMLQYIHTQHLQHFSSFASPKVVDQAFKTSVSHDLQGVAGKIRIPTLLIAGELDDIAPLNKQKELHQSLQNGSIVTIDGVGHLIHYEKAGEAAAAIRSFSQQ